MKLRDYQERDIDGIRKAFGRGARRVLHVLPTGGGKTCEFSEMVRLASERGNRAVVLVHRDSLLHQASGKLKDAGVKHGIIAPGHGNYGDTVHVASVQTLVRRLDRHQFDFIIVDESHRATAPTYKTIMDKWPDARVLGVTATPIRADGRGLDSVFQALHCGPSIADLIRDGYLAEPDTYGPKKKLDLSRIKTTAGDYDRGQLAEHMDAPRITGDAVSHYSEICPGAPAIAFCVNIKHAEDAAAMFKAAGFRSEAVHGKMKLPEIRDKLDALRDGDIQVLTSCDLISEGVDIIGVVCAIGLRPTKSLGLHIQQAGRALRPIYAQGHDLTTRAGRLAAIAAGPKPRAILLDHAANCFRHLTVDEPHAWTLEGKKKRSKASAKGMSLTQCEKCLRPYKSIVGKCPHCGHAPVREAREPDVVDGALERIDKEALRRSRWGEERACRTFEDFVALGKKRGYASGWARIRWDLRHQK